MLDTDKTSIITSNLLEEYKVIINTYLYLEELMKKECIMNLGTSAELYDKFEIYDQIISAFTKRRNAHLSEPLSRSRTLRKYIKK
jgi:hypothetical protein